MSSYVITGAARGIGYEFVRQLSANPKNTVFGIVRNKAATDEKVKTELNRDNIHILQADVTDLDALKKAADAVSKITGGKLDYVVANHAAIPAWSGFSTFGELFAEDPARLAQDLVDNFNVNTVGAINVFNYFVPLLLKGRAKKAIAISSGIADPELVVDISLDISPSYSISKAALNLAVTKFQAEYGPQGLLFLAISPGVVNTGGLDQLAKDQQTKAQEMFAKFQKYAPEFKGPITSEESVTKVLEVIEKSSIEGGQAGAFISHLGTKRWI